MACDVTLRKTGKMMARGEACDVTLRKTGKMMARGEVNVPDSRPVSSGQL